jgi:EAL domain-containing protein (putative c-di-GMP-specific phosphodiesterase class I)
MPEAHALASRIANELRSPLGSDAGTRPLPCRIGVVIEGPSYDAPADLLRDARCALERVPPEGGVELFDAAARVDHENRALLESEMRRAIGSREFFVEYQPVVALADGRITGLEAFVRWQHPQIGRIPPGEFIVAAEATPLIQQLGDWIVDTVCDQIRRWEKLLPAGSVPPVDINVSQAQLLDVGFADRLLATLRRHELPGNRIRLDVNESDLMDEPERCAGVLARLKERGVRSMIDDFGTGFSSVGLLHTLPVSGLKIDGSFVREAAGEGEGSSVARTIIELARVLGLDVIAEGVETREQFRYLRSAGCRQAQGRHFAGPVGAAAACDLIRDGYPLDLEAPLR